MHKKIDHVPTVRRAPVIRSELAKQRRLRLQQLEDLSVDAAEAHATLADSSVGLGLTGVGAAGPARRVTGGLIMITNCIIVGLTTRRPLGQRIGGRRSMHTPSAKIYARSTSWTGRSGSTPRPPSRELRFACQCTI
jgi:hypothetical protein